MVRMSLCFDLYITVDNTKGGKRLKRQAALDRVKMEKSIKVYHTVLRLLPLTESRNLKITDEHRTSGIWPWLHSDQCKNIICQHYYSYSTCDAWS